MAIDFNRQLKDRVIKLRAELPLVAITYVDVYTAKYNLISSTKTQGRQFSMYKCLSQLSSTK